MARSRMSRDQWIVLVSAQAASGMTAAAFCKLRKLPLASFYQWRRKLAATAELDGVGAEVVPVRIIADGSIDVELRCGATIRLPLANEDAMRKVLGTLVDLGHER